MFTQNKHHLKFLSLVFATILLVGGFFIFNTKTTFAVGETYPVTFSSTGEGSLTATVDGTPIASGDSVASGKDVVFTANPAGGNTALLWTIDGWQDIVGHTLSDNNIYTVYNLNHNTEVSLVFGVPPTMSSGTAVFNKNNPQDISIDIDINDGGGVWDVWLDTGPYYSLSDNGNSSFEGVVVDEKLVEGVLTIKKEYLALQENGDFRILIDYAFWGDDLVITITNAPSSITRDDDANTVTGMMAGMEYKLDSAGYVAYEETTFNALNFSGEHTLLVRIAASGETPASDVVTLTFTTNPVVPPTPPAPSVTRDDNANTVTGMMAGMEYKLDSAGYVAYEETTFNALDFSGEHTLLVRIAASGENLASDAATLIFTTNPIPPVTPSAPIVTADDTNNVIVGLNLVTMEYSLDGGTSWIKTESPDLNGNKTVLVRIGAEGINPASDPVTLIFTINQYTITFETAGGTPVASITDYFDSAITAPTDPTRTGYTFAGWTPSIPATMGLDQTITAEWTDSQAPVLTLVGPSSIIIEFGSTYIDEGAIAEDNLDTNITVNTIGTVNTSIAGIYTLTYTAEDEARNNAVEITRTVTVAEEEQTLPSESGEANLSGDTTQVLLIDDSKPITINVEDDTEDPSIDISSLIDEDTGIASIPQITINSSIAHIVIPEGTISSNGIAWNGILAAPTITTVTFPRITGETRTLETAIELGLPEAKLSFNEAVKITLPGQATKRAGYSRPGTAFTEITTICKYNTQSWANENLPADGECKINVGADLVIWTKHFTTFAAYTQTKNTGSIGGRARPTATAETVVPNIVTPSESAISTIGMGQVLGAEKYYFTKFLKISTRGLEVVELQKLLNGASYDCGIADGIFGQKTKAAVIKFQIANGLRGDGIIGPLTRALLNK